MSGNRTCTVGIALAIRIAVLISVLGGCGGGGGSGSELPTASLTVAVSDVFGEPAERAQVEVLVLSTGKTLKATTNASGGVRFVGVPAGKATIHVSPSGDLVTGVSFSGSLGPVEMVDGGALDVDVTLRPEGDPFAAIRASWVEASGLSPDGRSLDLTFDIYSFGSVQALYLADCEPDAADDAPTLRPNCIQGPVAFDAPYGPPGYAQRIDAPIPGRTTAPFSVAVLLDQGRGVALNDSADLRLFAVKYFLSMLQPEDRVLLSAFASDDAGGARALLPDGPVTMLPDNVRPTFAASNRAVLFPIVDSLAALEGGASPLYAAIDKMLDVTTQNTLPDRRRAVVVLTGAADTTCGSSAQCLTARQALISKARATGVSIIMIGLGSESEAVDVVALSELAEGSSGALLWTNSPRQLPTLFGGLIQILDGSADTFEAHYEIQSPTDGAFQSGRTVLGKVSVSLPPCPLDCSTIVDVPFAARIP